MKRLVMIRKPRSLPIGTVRQWSSGAHVKVGRAKWAKVLAAKARAEKLARKVLSLAPEGESGGLAGLAHAILREDAAADPQTLASAAQRVAEALSRQDEHVVPLIQALAIIKAGGGDTAWETYCARRWAEFNGGMVNMAAIPEYAKQAKAYHGGEFP